MAQTVGITKVITNLNDAHEKFHLVQTADTQFFKKWLEELSELTDTEKALLDRLKSRYLYYAAEGFILESTVSIIILS